MAYADVADRPAYRRHGISYRDLCDPDLLRPPLHRPPSSSDNCVDHCNVAAATSDPESKRRRVEQAAGASPSGPSGALPAVVLAIKATMRHLSLALSRSISSCLGRVS